MSAVKKKRFSHSNNDECPELSEPVAKRTRSSIKLLELSKVNDTVPKTDNEVQDGIDYNPTILDILNDDCWQIILDYVKMGDILRSETVSRSWRDMLHRYFRAVRLCIRSNLYHTPNPTVPSAKSRVVKVRPLHYVEAVQKFGSCIVAADCESEANLRCLGRYCPDLEDLTLLNNQYHNPRRKPIKFSKLRYLYIKQVTRFKDTHMSNLLLTPLTELKLRRVNKMTGTCLQNLKPGLNYLQLSTCQRLNIDDVVTAADRLADLTRLDLTCNSNSVILNAYKLIKLLPKLEYLVLEWYDKIKGDEKLLEAICGLKRLTHLCVAENSNVTDVWLEAVARSCRYLRVVDVSGCEGVTAKGVLSLCRHAGDTLTALGVTHNVDLTDQDIARCIRCCPKLQMLNLCCCRSVTPLLPSLCSEAAGQRADQLTILLNLSRAWTCELKQECYPNLILDYKSLERNYEKYIM